MHVREELRQNVENQSNAPACVELAMRCQQDGEHEGFRLRCDALNAGRSGSHIRRHDRYAEALPGQRPRDKTAFRAQPKIVSCQRQPEWFQV